MHNPPLPTGKPFQAIYLGDVKPNQYIDRFEGLPGTETSFTLLSTTFGSADAPLTQRIVTITTQDRNGDGMLRGDTPLKGVETFSTDRPLAVEGGTASVFNFDGVTQYRATLTYLDGSQAKGAVVTVMQDDLGRTFLVPNLDGSNAALTAGPVKSLKLTGLAELDPFNNNLATARPGMKFVPCFAGGTRIMTAKGQRPVERIAVGDLVQTLDHGLQVVRWAGARRLDALDLAANPALLPIRIRRGALGERLPKRDLIVSPQHRMMVRSAIARSMFGADEVLVAAKHLLALDGVEIASDLREVSYHHILFDRHEIVISEGAASESLFLGPQALLALGEGARHEILALFPELKAGLPDAGARAFLNGRQGRGLAQRHGALPLQ